MKTNNVILTMLQRAVMGTTFVLVVAHSHAGSPPYTNVSVYHWLSGTKDYLFDYTGYGSQYPTGAVDETSGTLYHSSFAYTVGVWGGSSAAVLDRMDIPFTVLASGSYNVSASGSVIVNIYSDGFGEGLYNTDWGDFTVDMIPMLIFDETDGTITYSTPISSVYRKTLRC